MPTEPFATAATESALGCNIPSGCLIDDMRKQARLPLPARDDRPSVFDHRENGWNCREPRAYRLLLWDMSVDQTVEVCALHALGAALYAIDSHPKIKGVEALVPPDSGGSA